MPDTQQAPIDRAEALACLARSKTLAPLGAVALGGLLTQAGLKLLRGRAVLFREGDAGVALYLVLSGWVKLARSGAAGRDVVLDFAGPGDVFGELAVLCGTARAADAVALTPTRLLVMDGRAMLAAFCANPAAMLAVVRLLGERLAHATELLADGRLPAEARLARALLRLAKPDGTQGLGVDLGLSQSDLAEMTGLARESINKILGGWREAEAIAMAGRRIAIMRLATLRSIAAGEM